MSMLEVRSPRYREVRQLPKVTQFGRAGSPVCFHSSQHVSHVLQLWGSLPFPPHRREGKPRPFSSSLEIWPSPC